MSGVDLTEAIVSAGGRTAARVEEACVVMHDAYEAAAISAGWKTNRESRKPWASVPDANKVTMRAAMRALYEWLELDAKDRTIREQAETLAGSATGWTPREWENWSNEIAVLLPERYDDDVAQESIIPRAVADMVETLRRVRELCDRLADPEIQSRLETPEGRGPQVSVGFVVAELRATLAGPTPQMSVAEARAQAEQARTGYHRSVAERIADLDGPTS